MSDEPKIDPFARKQRWRFRGKGPTGRNLCHCGCGNEVQPPRRTAFSDECVKRWNESNNPVTIRRVVLERDGGKCAACGLEAEKIRKAFRGVGCPYLFEFGDLDYAGEYLRAARVSHETGIPIKNGYHEFKGNELLREVIEQTHWAEEEIRAQWHEWGLNEADNLPFEKRCASWWEADHITPVAEGGGGCGPEDYRTLCLRCHRLETKALAGRLSRAVLTPCCKVKPSVVSKEGDVLAVRCECERAYRYNQAQRRYVDQADLESVPSLILTA